MKIAAAAVLFLTSIAVCADEPPAPRKPPAEWRRHFVLRDSKAATVHYEVTEVVRLTDDSDSNHLLVNDTEHGQYILERRAEWADKEASYTIRDLSGRAYVKAAFKVTQFAAKTRDGMLREAAEQPDLKFLPTLLTLTTNGGEWRSVDTDARDWERLRQMRHSVRRTVPADLLEAIERMRGTIFATSEGSIFYDIVGEYLVYQNGDEGLQLEQVRTAPNCDFDKSFGHPCSERQQKKVEAAAEKGERLEHY
jgi:hypothetical protein